MKKVYKIGILPLVFIILLVMVACSSKYSLADLEAVEFANQEVDYDGKAHSLAVGQMPEEFSVSYTTNSFIEPGEYFVTATISYKDLEVEKRASLTINKVESDLSASSQEVLVGNSVLYTIGNDEQKVSIVAYLNGDIYPNYLYEEGSYNLVITAAESDHYKSKTVGISIEVIKSKFGLSYESKTFVADGSEHEITLTGTIPSGYTVTYTNNKATEAGTYYAKAEVKDSNNEIVETHQAVLSIENPDNEEFATFLDDFLVTYLEGDQLSVNIFFEHPENYGIGHYDPIWYTYTRYEEGDISESLAYYESLKADLEEFKDAKLSVLQKSAYNTVYDLLDYLTAYYSIPEADYMQVIYVDQFGGYVADFGTYMEAYSLRGKQDIEDVISYITSTSTAFPSYLDFVADKASHGYPLSDFTITSMQDYLTDVVANDTYYLTDILKDSINGLTFITDAEKAEYITRVEDAINDSFIPAVKELNTGLSAYLGLADESNDGYWSEYEKGSELYELELENLLGLDIEPSSYIASLERTLRDATSLVQSATNQFVYQFHISTYAELNEIVASHSIFDGTPEEMLTYLKEFAKTMVPDLKTDPEIVVKEMDAASAAVSNAVAYYMKSAIDNTGEENITLNPVQLANSSANDVLATMAHEGYPGHLYAYVYSKELNLSTLAKIMSNTAHAEGWATYVALSLYEYAYNNTTDEALKCVLNYLYANEYSGFLIETILDAYIHFYGWGVDEVADYLEESGYDSSSAEDIYNLLIEMPASYAAYGYGKMFFVDLHDEAKALLGSYYDEIEFNAMLLSKGWTNLAELTNTYNEYMSKICYEHKIPFTAR